MEVFPIRIPSKHLKNAGSLLTSKLVVRSRKTSLHFFSFIPPLSNGTLFCFLISPHWFFPCLWVNCSFFRWFLDIIFFPWYVENDTLKAFSFFQISFICFSCFFLLHYFPLSLSFLSFSSLFFSLSPAWFVKTNRSPTSSSHPFPIKLCVKLEKESPSAHAFTRKNFFFSFFFLFSSPSRSS